MGTVLQQLIPVSARTKLRPLYQAWLNLTANGPAGLIFALSSNVRGARVHPGVVIHGMKTPHLRLLPGAVCTIGLAQFSCNHWLLRQHFVVTENGVLTIEDGTYINAGVAINCNQSVHIEAGCLIGPSVRITDSSGHRVDESGPLDTAPVRIGRNVWIGANAIILPGVTIGDHSMIGAGSVVTGPIPERTLAAGNPCHVIRKINASDGWRREH